MLEAQKQQHLRTLRRSLNRAVTSLKDGTEIVCHSGWDYGTCFQHPWLEDRGESVLEPELDGVFLFLPNAEAEELDTWAELIPSGVRNALEYFWPGPLHLTIRLKPRQDGSIPRLTVACPWHPLLQEFLSRSGALFWRPLEPELSAQLKMGHEPPAELGKALIWPEAEVPLRSTLLDTSTRPWRLLRQGFVGVDELRERVEEPVVLSQERAFPVRPIQTYIPEGKTIVVEADKSDAIPGAVQTLRQQVPPDCFVRIYLDEAIAHTHFPDDREVRVYGELSDLERVRRRLQAMLERQNRRFGKRVLLIAVSDLGPGSESFRADLVKLSDGWLKVGEELVLPL